MCGEQKYGRRVKWLNIGSPPRVRGTVRPQESDLAVLGITPACAGNSAEHRHLAAGERDHPRVCGEQRMSVLADMEKHGSPPRVRGTGYETYTHKYKTGITPACAGNRSTLRKTEGAGRDHPRVCGEQGFQAVLHLLTQGSPPRVRGTAISSLSWRAAPGITPACAGNSDFYESKGWMVGDHPRVCGEQKLP